jgi:hypothetical protein
MRQQVMLTIITVIVVIAFAVLCYTLGAVLQ